MLPHQSPGALKTQKTLNETFSASGIAADGSVCFTPEEGNVYVVKAVPAFQLLSKNALKVVFMATPAISGNMLFIQEATFFNSGRIRFFFEKNSTWKVLIERER